MPRPACKGSALHADCQLTCDVQVKGGRIENGLQWRSACISLDGLLDYDESDRDEATLELSLFAESFQDMLMRDYGLRILDCLQAERRGSASGALDCLRPDDTAEHKPVAVALSISI